MLTKLFAALMTVIVCMGGVVLAAPAPTGSEPTVVSNPATESPATLTAEQAETIALEALGFTRDQVRFDKTELDREKGKTVWEVEFDYGTTEYDFEIDAYTGEILKQKTEADDDKRPGSKPVSPPAEETPAQPEESPATLTAEQAETIAWETLGLTREQVRFDRTELDYEGGVQVWEVEFRYENTEYDFEIHADTGEILKQKEEQKKAPKEETSKEETPAQPEETPAELTKEEAVAIALAHAGLTEEQVARMKIEKDRDDGICVYEIDFKHDGFEYEYEIRVSDGVILDYDKEWDD